jgi:hypothetical protein
LIYQAFAQDVLWLETPLGEHSTADAQKAVREAFNREFRE